MAKKSSLIPEYSIICPIYNESDSIQHFYERITEVMKNIGSSFEVVFVNDGSKDDSLDQLIELHKKDKKMKIINLSRNFGKEVAMTAGIDHSVGNAVIPIDADLQDPPEIIPELIKKWKEGYDVVYAMRSKRRGETALKRMTAFFFYKIINMFTKIDIPRNTGDFRLMDRRVVNALNKLREHHRFMKGLFSWVGFKQIGVYYQRDPRYAGKSKWNYIKLINFAIEGITSFSYIPLKFASYIGGFVSFSAFCYAAYIIIKRILFGDPVQGYASQTAIILFLGGVQLLTVGIIGEYIGRIYFESKARKLYFIRDYYGIKEKEIDQNNYKNK